MSNPKESIMLSYNEQIFLKGLSRIDQIKYFKLVKGLDMKSAIEYADLFAIFVN